MKKVAIVILNYKLKKETLECLESVRSSNYQDLHIIVIDNHSEDGLSSEIKKFPEVTFIENKENLGYSGGNNVGIKIALKEGMDYVFILNPDASLDKDCVLNLIEVATRENAGIVGPKIYFADKKTIWYAGGIFDKDNVSGSHRGVDEKDHGQYEKTEQTDFVSGAAILIDKVVFKKIGFFDERFFLYYEDADFCFRAKKAGLKILYSPKGKVFHKNASSTGLGSPLQDYYITRSRLLFAFKHLSFRTKFALLREVVKNISNPKRRLALFDFLIGKFGKGSI